MRGSHHKMRVLLALMTPLATVQQSLSPLFQTTSPVLVTVTATPVFTATVAPVLTTGTANPVFATTTPVGATTAPAFSGATANPATNAPNGWTGCDDPATMGEPILIGKKTTICVVLASNADWNPGLPATKYLRLSFQPVADEYSRFHVPSCKSPMNDEKHCAESIFQLCMGSFDLYKYQVLISGLILYLASRSLSGSGCDQGNYHL
jgi:hypothetical protein